LYFAGVLTDRFLHVFSRAAGWLGCSWVVWMSGGCLSSPEAQTETLEVTVPAQWEAAASGEAFEPQAWGEDFSDPQLEALLEEALAHYFSLMAAAARRDAAVAGTVAARSSLWPTLGLEGSYNESSRQVGVDGGTSNDINTTSYGLSGRFAWEIDLWGRLRNGYRADLADAEAAQAEFEATRLSIAANTARAWYTAVEARLLLELAEQTLEAFLENERTVEEGFERGIGGALEVRLVRANVASARSAVEGTQRNLADALRAVELLLGRYPAAEIAVARTWPELTATVPAGLPTDLDAAQVWSQVWSLSQPLFQGGRLRAEAERNEALERQAVANYTQAVLVAFGEVEDTLDEQASYARDHAMTRLAAEESIEAGNLAWERYEAGLADIITALDADRRSINAQQALIQVTHRRIQSRINLYLALGGGFLSDDPPASPESLP
jgi:outer membrane protein TolC